MELKVVALSGDIREDFYRIHSGEGEMKGCYCTAWWVPTWDEWENRTPEQNHAFRDGLFQAQVSDGFIIYADGRPFGWCQCGPRDRMPKIRQTYNLVPDPAVWAISCFYLIPEFREIGLGHYFLGEIIKILRNRGVKYVQGFPRRGKEMTPKEVWTGPESIYRRAGFILEQENDNHPVYGLNLET